MRVNETFLSLQGEGHFTGTPAFFLRFAGCNLECPFCDTNHQSYQEMSEEEIAHYVEVYRPLDKAGAYGIQEWIGYVACTALNGSYFNVMGLPTERLWEELVNEWDYRI